MQVDLDVTLPTGGSYKTFSSNPNYTTGLLVENLTFTEDSSFPEHYSLVEKIAIGIVLGIIIFCSIAGNTLVCVAILTDRTLRKTSNFFYISLACADALVAAMVMTFAVANDIQGYWVFGQTYCDIWLSSDVMCSTSSILNICAISMDRYLHIRNPYHYDRIMTTKRTLLCIAALWVLSALISFLPIQLGWHQTEDHNPWVGDKFLCLMELNPIYAISSSIISFYVPCVIMIAIYIRLYLFARRHVKSIRERSVPAFSGNITANSSTHTGQGYKTSDHKAAITLGVIMGTFLFCWVPFFTINIIAACCDDCVPGIVFSITTWLGYLNSMANPIIYPIFNKEFRVAFQRVLSFKRCCDWCVKHDYGKPLHSANGNTTATAMEYGALKVTIKGSPSSKAPLLTQTEKITQL